MIERYKVLAAMLALGEFTVAELSRFSGVRPSTIYTVVNRERHFLEPMNRQTTGRRGGQFIQHRVKADQVGALRSEIDELFRQLRVLPGLEPELTPKIPLSLVASWDALVHLYPQAKGLEEKQHLFRLAEMDFENGQTETKALLARVTDSRAVERIQAHVRAVEALKNLCMVELARESDFKPKEPIDFPMVREQLLQVADEFSSLGENEHAVAALRRVVSSPALKALEEQSNFRSMENKQLSVANRPASSGYVSAQRYLNKVQNTIGPDRKQLLADAERDLQIGEQFTGGSPASEPIRAALQYERARLAYLRGE